MELVLGLNAHLPTPSNVWLSAANDLGSEYGLDNMLKDGMQNRTAGTTHKEYVQGFVALAPSALVRKST